MLIAGRMLLIALVIGCSLTITATERVTVSLVLAGAVGWGFVPVLQLLTGLILTGIKPSPGIRLGLERYFDVHWPWSLWILAASALFLMVPSARGYGLGVAVTAAVPLIWTVQLLIVYCRRVLGLSAAEARRRVALHQIATYSLALAYLNFAVALWPRIVALLPWR